METFIDLFPLQMERQIHNKNNPCMEMVSQLVLDFNLAF